MRQTFLIVLAFILICPVLNQQIVTNIPFECKGRRNGFWRDLRYCDVFHACVAGELKRSYGCPQVGERFFFNEATQRCEFVSQNAGGCQTNQYYVPIANTPAFSGSQLSTQAPSEQWRIFAQSREQYNCAGQQDGFYASRWCNVFYRCESGISRAFLCPSQQRGGRLWWIGHGSPQSVREEAAMCTYPCDTGRPCSSPGGIIVDDGNQVSESQQAAETVYRQSLCSNQTSQMAPGTGQSGAIQTGTGQFSNPQTGTGQFSNPQTGTGQFSNPQTGTGQFSNPQIGTGQFGTPQTGMGQFSTNQPGGSGNQGSSSNTGGLFTVDSDVSCNGQAEGAFLSSRYCNVFHRCISGTRFDFRCPRAVNASYDLWWNQQTNLCDWPCRVQCNNQLYGSSSSAQQVQTESLLYFDDNCRSYPRTFNANK